MRLPLLCIVLLSGVAAGPALAQTEGLTLRVDKLEKEMRAVQRKVFPQGNVQPEIGVTTPPPVAAGTPSTAPIADLTARVDALEAQLRGMTGQVEQDGNRVRKLEELVKALDARLKTLEGAGAEPTATGTAGTPRPAEVTPVSATTAARAPATRPALAPPSAPAVRPAAVRNDPARAKAIAAVEMPDTGNAAEDAYTYGFRLWQAKLYPEAQVKLKEFVAKNPKHRRTSYAQNLLGRAYFDEGKPALASVAFYDNYTKNPKGERAAESLSWLGTALIRLKKLPDACKVFDEFDEVYGTAATAEIKARVAKGRADAKCAA